MMDAEYKSRTLPYGYLLILLNKTNIAEIYLDLYENHLSDLFLTLAILSIVIAYISYYLKSVVHKPKLVCGNDMFRKLLQENCPIVKERYWPSVWAPQTHTQTFFRVALQTFPTIKRRRELFKLSDGGQLYLDWCNESCDLAQNKPTVILLPGITGSFDENYIRHFVEDIRLVGCQTVVFNYRGLGGAKLSTPKLDCLGSCNDLSEVINHVKSKRSKSSIFLVGTSMGGIQIISFLAKCAKQAVDPHVLGALVISVPWQLNVAYEKMDQHVNRYTINTYVTKKITRILHENEELFMEAEVNEKSPIRFRQASGSSSFTEVVRHITCPMFGFKDVDDFISFASPHLKLHLIQTPLVCLSSSDDVYCPTQALPHALISQNGHVAMVTTQRGGHIGFMEGVWPFHKNWMDRFLVQTLQLFVDKHQDIQKAVS